MKTARKIFLNKKDKVASVVKWLTEIKEKRVILNFPDEAVFNWTVDDFGKLKKQAGVLDKEIAIESVNEDILRLAEAACLKAFNPLFRQEEIIVSDIVPNVVKPEQPKSVSVAPSPAKPISVKTMPQFRIKPKRQLVLSLGIIILLFSAGIIGALIWLPKATINIQLQKLNLDFNRLVEGDKSFKKVEVTLEKIILPVELLTNRSNLKLFFPATGKEKIAEKAKGRLIVYNAYSSEPQTLVASTRFVSPEGKIFRLDEKITIPGAKIINGQIQPSSIEVNVTADQTGEAYNLPLPSASKKAIWRIPGFEGTPKYQGFYAEAKTAMTGGFIGEAAVPTSDDIVKARSAIEKALKENLKSQMAILLTNDLKVFDEAISFNVLRFEADRRANEKNEFGVFAEAEMSYLVFNEKEMREALTANLIAAAEAKNNLSLTVKTFDWRYENPKIDFVNGRLSFNLAGQTVLQPVFNADDFISQIAGLNKKTLEAKVFSLPGLARGRISLWPFWVKRVPTKENRIKLFIE